MLKKTVLNLSIAAALLAASGTILGAATPVNIAVAANVSKACSFSAAAAGLNFGDYDPIGVNATADKTGTAQVSVTCAKGAATVTIGLDYGTHISGTTQRQMAGPGADLLSYNVFQPASNAAGAACPGTIPWTTTGTGLLSLEDAPSKATRVYNVCGTIPMGQDVTTGAYTDTIIATLNF